VLFESAAAGTPFLSVPVGNSAEIARWTGAGVICSAFQDGKGYTKVDPEVLGEYWSRLVKDRAYLRQLGEAGKEKWAERFTWQNITDKYEEVFRKVSIDE
jgi:glycosyltransferase involved in cell wall biosynthesis